MLINRVQFVGELTLFELVYVDQNSGGKYIKDDKGNIVQSKLDMTTLATLAEATGGRAYSITPNQSEIYTILNDINKLEKSKFANKLHTVYKHQYFYFAFLALLFLLVEFFVFRCPTLNKDRFLN